VGGREGTLLQAQKEPTKLESASQRFWAESWKHVRGAEQWNNQLYMILWKYQDLGHFVEILSVRLYRALHQNQSCMFNSYQRALQLYFSQLLLVSRSENWQ
jgi:hypothetical protein